MAGLGKLWTGRIYGTNTGNLFAQLHLDGTKVTGTIRLNDPIYGVSVHAVDGTFEGSTLKATAVATRAPEGSTHGSVSFSGVLMDQGTIRGTWESKSGTGGTFELFPHDVPADQTKAVGNAPEQIHTKTMPLGLIRIYEGELEELVNFLRRDFTVGRMIVTYALRGSEVTVYIDDFLRNPPKQDVLRSLKLHIQELEAHGISKAATVELNPVSNVVRVQGIHESWVVGKCSSIHEYFKKFQVSVATQYKKFGVNVVPVLLVILALAWMIEIEDVKWRLVFVAVAAALLLAVAKFHTRFIPNAAIYPAKKQPHALLKAAPAVLSWTATIVGSVIGGVILHKLTDVPKESANIVVPLPSVTTAEPSADVKATSGATSREGGTAPQDADGSPRMQGSPNP